MNSLDAIRQIVEAARAADEAPIVAKVEGSMPTAKPPLDCVFIKQRFMAAIGCPELSTAGGPA